MFGAFASSRRHLALTGVHRRAERSMALNATLIERVGTPRRVLRLRT